jgi:hypothetical protein
MKFPAEVALQRQEKVGNSVSQNFSSRNSSRHCSLKGVKQIFSSFHKHLRKRSKVPNRTVQVVEQSSIARLYSTVLYP